MRLIRTLVLCAALLASTTTAASVAYSGYVGSRELYGGPGVDRSFSRPYGDAWPAPQETATWERTAVNNARFAGTFSVNGDMDEGKLLAFAAAASVSSPGQGGGALPGISSGHLLVEWLDYLKVKPNVVRDSDGYLRLPWHIDFAGSIEIEGTADPLTGAQFTARVEALARPGFVNILGYSSPTFQGLELTYGYYGQEGVSIFDVGSLPQNPFRGVLAIPPWADDVYLHGSLRLDAAARLIGAGGSLVTAGVERPFRFVLDDSRLRIQQIVQSQSGADYTLEPVPEPASWGLTLAGLAAFGILLRRRLTA